MITTGLQDFHQAQASALIFQEAKRTVTLHGEFHSAHEGYAVLLEEVDELWDAIKKNDNSNAIEEATQVGAMALRLLAYVTAKG